MTRLAQLGDSVSGPGMMAHLREFARWTKHAGTPEELQSLRYVEARFRQYGYRSVILFHDAYISLPGAARIAASGGDIACITHSFSRPSPAGGVTGRLVDLGAGTPADFAGKNLAGAILLIDGIASPQAAMRATAAGAVAQIHVSPYEHRHEMCISPVWGSPTHVTVERLPGTVVVTVSQQDGVRLRADAAACPTIHAEVDTGWRRIPVLIAEMDAPVGGNDAPFLLFSGHHDTWHYGVMDNGGANATMLEVARICALHRSEWQRGLRLAVWSGHSQGRYASSAWYADANWDELDRRCVAHVNIDSTGARGNTHVADAPVASELAALAGEAVAAQSGQTLTGKRVARFGDQSFWGIGIPAIFCSMGEQPPVPPRVGAISGWWWHTPQDTLDKMDETLLVRDTRIYLHAVWRLLTDRVLPLDYAAHAAALLAELDSLAAALGARFDLAPLRAAAARLKDAAGRLRSHTADTDRINAVLMKMSRALVPIDYTAGDRFDQDAALPQPPWPVLQPLRLLAAATGDQAKFTAVAATRAANRVAAAVRAAREAAESCLGDTA